MNPRIWVETATAQIRFGPDRDAVRQELFAHIEDLTDHFMQEGLTPQKAQYEAVAAMGDPRDIAPELGRLHNPLPGWLWKLSRWAVILAAAYLLFIIAASLINREAVARERYQPRLPGEVGTTVTAVNDYGSAWQTEILAAWTPEGHTMLGGYRFSAPLAWVGRTSYEFDGIPSSSCTLTLCIRASTWRIWESAHRSQYMILAHEATDSHAALYGRWDPGLFSAQTHRSYFCSTYEGGPGTSWYEVQLDLPNGEADIPDWVEVPIGYGGHVLRVDLAKEVVG